MKILTMLISCAVALVYLWIAHHAVVTSLDELIFWVSVVVFFVFWLTPIWLKKSGIRHGDTWIKGLGYFFFAVQIAYLVSRAIQVMPYDDQILIVTLVSWFGLFINIGYRLIEDKVVV